MAIRQQGTVIHGTMRREDLIPALRDELKSVSPSEYEIWANRNVPFADGAYDHNDDLGAELALEELFDFLNNLAPEGWYFGANEGDGSDYGWWIDPEIEWECDNG